MLCYAFSHQKTRNEEKMGVASTILVIDLMWERDQLVGVVSSAKRYDDGTRDREIRYSFSDTECPPGYGGLAAGAVFVEETEDITCEGPRKKIINSTNDGRCFYGE